MNFDRRYIVGEYGELSRQALQAGDTGQSAGYPVFVVYGENEDDKTADCACFVLRHDAEKFAEVMNQSN